jgi:type IX secretion system PorP/SprF family membrane protein
MKRLLTILFFLPLATFAQDPNYSTMLNSAAFINPAMAATDTMDYAAIKYRNQWPALTGNYVTTSAYYSHYSSFLNSATYIIGSHDVAGRGSLKTTRVGIGYAQKIKLGDDFLIQAAIEAVYFQKSLDWSKLTFGDMIDPRRGFVYATSDTPRGGTASGIDFSSGITLSYKSAYIGFSGHHLTQPNESLILGDSRLPLKIGMQLGYKIYIGGKWSIEPVVFYQQQDNFSNLNLSCFARANDFVLGLGYRNKDAFLGTVGFEGAKIRTYYSYDLTVSRLGSGTGGSHEISLAYRFWKKAPHDKYLEF